MILLLVVLFSAKHASTDEPSSLQRLRIYSSYKALCRLYAAILGEFMSDFLDHLDESKTELVYEFTAYDFKSITLGVLFLIDNFFFKFYKQI